MSVVCGIAFTHPRRYICRGTRIGGRQMSEESMDRVVVEPSHEAEREDPVPVRSRRSLLAGVAAAAGAIVAQAATAPLPAGAANGSTVKVGQTNTGTSPTKVQNTRHATNARGLV